MTKSLQTPAANQCCQIAGTSDTTASIPPLALQKLLHNGARIPNLEKLYQLPADKRDAALANLLLRILQRFAEHEEISNDRMKLALGFDRPQLMQWWQHAREKVAAARQAS
jgi:hypothetical protein